MGGQSSKEINKQTTDSTESRLEPFFQRVKNSCENVTENNFKSLFSSEGHQLVARIFTKLIGNDGNFLENVQTLFSGIFIMQTLTEKNTFYLSLYEYQNNEDIEEFVKTAFALFLTNLNISHNATESDETMLKAVEVGLKSPIVESNNYLQTSCPGLIAELHNWLIGQILSTRLSENADFVDGPSVASGQLLNTASWWLFTCSLPSLYTSIQSTSNSLKMGRQYLAALYNSSEHGQSINRFQHHVLAYQGPTITLISFEDHTIAVALDTEWREGTDRIGGSNSSCIMLTTKYEIIEEGDGMVTFNVRSRNVIKGISIGRNLKNPVVFIDSGMEEVTYKMKTYSLKRIEVWGCGGDTAKSEQIKQKERELKDTERNLKVKRPGRWDENPDRYLLEMGGVKVTHAEK